MKKYFAEFIGIFVLTFVSCGVVVISGGITGVLVGAVLAANIWKLISFKKEKYKFLQ